MDPLENIPDIDRFDNFFVQFIKFTDEKRNFEGPYVDLIPIGNFINLKSYATRMMGAFTLALKHQE